MQYDQEQRNWLVFDGNGIKSSMNGTWYLADNVEIYNKMMIRVGTTTFEASLKTGEF